jgi:hypothetical protein
MGLAIMCCGERCFCRSPRRPCGRQMAQSEAMTEVLRPKAPAPAPAPGIQPLPSDLETSALGPSPWHDLS